MNYKIISTILIILLMVISIFFWIKTKKPKIDIVKLSTNYAVIVCLGRLYIQGSINSLPANDLTGKLQIEYMEKMANIIQPAIGEEKTRELKKLFNDHCIRGQKQIDDIVKVKTITPEILEGANLWEDNTKNIATLFSETMPKTGTYKEWADLWHSYLSETENEASALYYKKYADSITAFTKRLKLAQDICNKLVKA